MSSMEVSSDDILRATDEDAAISRLSSAHQNYIDDPFACFFIGMHNPPIRRSPLINRGTYLRIFAIDQILKAFLQYTSRTPSQIVNLGAGTDTRFFRFKKFHSDLLSQTRYFEIDLKETVLQKISTIRRRKALSDLLNDVCFASTSLTSNQYCLLSGDLRNWSTALEALNQAGFQSELPTLVISECVFIYLQPNYVDVLLQWMHTLPSSVFICYEQIIPDDPFGAVMLKNLKIRDIYLPGIYVTPSLEAHQKRLEPLFDKLILMDMNTFWTDHVPASEKQRIAKLEIFDEIEEWQLICEHYCIIVATHHCELPGWTN